MTTLGHSTAAPPPFFGTNTLLTTILFGLAVFAAKGVDFPNSNRRFSRLV